MESIIRFPLGYFILALGVIFSFVDLILVLAHMVIRWFRMTLFLEAARAFGFSDVDAEVLLAQKRLVH